MLSIELKRAMDSRRAAGYQATHCRHPADRHRRSAAYTLDLQCDGVLAALIRCNGRFIERLRVITVFAAVMITKPILEDAPLFAARRASEP
jgi:hypothetical protein